MGPAAAVKIKSPSLLPYIYLLSPSHSLHLSQKLNLRKRKIKFTSCNITTINFNSRYLKTLCQLSLSLQIIESRLSTTLILITSHISISRQHFFFLFRFIYFFKFYEITCHSRARMEEAHLILSSLKLKQTCDVEI